MNSFEKDHGAWQASARLFDCPSCGARSSARSFYRVESIPVHSCVLLASPQEARAFPTRDLELAFCEGCGFVFNAIFDEAIMAYSVDFEESQHFSGTFNAFARDLAREMADKCGISGKQVLEIGCGKGEFLRELCAAGGATGLGIDPGYRADAGRGTEGAELQFIVDRFGPAYRHLTSDMVLCRHTLEHISKVSDFIGLIREMIADRKDTEVVFETPDAKRVLDEGAFWDIYYEHCSYFSPGTHARLFRQHGFDVTELKLVYDGQYIVQYARPADGPTEPRLPLEEDIATMQALVSDFPARVTARQQRWRDAIRNAAKAGDRVALWGGGSKAVSFVTTLKLGPEIAAVVDINPYKQGKFLPGTGHCVIAPEELKPSPPDLVVVMNPIYLGEVTRALHDLGLAPEIVAV